MKKICRSLSIPLIACIGLSACNSGNQENTQAPAAATGATNSAAGMNAPLTADEVKVTLQLQNAPQVSADGKSLVATVQFGNAGSAVLVSAGKYPVSLSAHAADTSGKIVINDLPRAHIPATPPGGHATVDLVLPVSQILGRQIRILPVQEHIAWFDHWGVKPLVIGPFAACAAPDQNKICDANGKPLTVK